MVGVIGRLDVGVGAGVKECDDVAEAVGTNVADCVRVGAGVVVTVGVIDHVVVFDNE